MTAIGLVFAVLTERISWAVAFKTVVFMPMAISLFATGVIWHLMYLKDPSQGAVNAAIGAVKSWCHRRARCRRARRPPPRSSGTPQTGYVLQQVDLSGRHGALMGLTAIPPTDVPSTREAGRDAEARAGRDHRRRLARLQAGRRHARARSSRGSRGCPGVTVELIDATGKTVQTTTTARRRLVHVRRRLGPASYKVGIARVDVRGAVRGHLVARAEADHARR